MTFEQFSALKADQIVYFRKVFGGGYDRVVVVQVRELFDMSNVRCLVRWPSGSMGWVEYGRLFFPEECTSLLLTL